MVSLKQKRQQGFTIVELLIVIVIIGILAGLVVTQFLGANQQARDSERKTDINSIASQLEVYYAKAGGYPTPTNLTSETWRKGNSVNAGDQGKALIAPGGTAPSATDIVTATTISRYEYTVAPTGCQAATGDAGAPANPTTPCTSFTLKAKFENTKDSTLDANGNYVKKNAE